MNANDKIIKGIFLDELSQTEQMLWKAIQSRINLERNRGVAIRDLYLRPELFAIYEGIRKRAQDRVESEVGLVFDGVHIQKGSIVQNGAFVVGTPWARKLDDRQRQREELKMVQLN